MLVCLFRSLWLLYFWGGIVRRHAALCRPLARPRSLLHKTKRIFPVVFYGCGRFCWRNMGSVGELLRGEAGLDPV